ncbi:MAG: TonB-dependent receptor [Bacteroidetes bacterium]|nr:TonB-dependent receptor [Bacteroidota bacterium]
MQNLFRKIIFLCYWIVLIFLPQSIYAQYGTVKGNIFEYATTPQSKSALIGASIFWKGTTIGTTSDLNGHFSLDIPDKLPLQLVVSFVGFNSDTLTVVNLNEINIFLKPAISLSEFIVEGRQDAIMLSTIKPINVEQIGQKELLKAACCNLSESFETNPSVNVSYTDAITGAKEIQMLGLSGIYSQVMTENIPNVRGLASVYGLNYVPGPWMESIQITKGSGSVANGYESTSGQINVEYLKPEKADKFYINGYGASTGNLELNIHKAFKVSDKVNSILFLHGENMQTKWDHQNDKFLDMPLVSQANVFNRWSYNDGKKFEGQFGVKAIYEKRRSGQTFYKWNDTADSTSGYGVQITTKRIEVFYKSGMVFPATPWKSAGLILSGSFHDQNSYFGIKTYTGNQKSAYGSIIYMSIIGNTNHKWKTGIDWRHDIYNEKYLLAPYLRTENVPGIYAEYTFNRNEKFGFVAGSRLDLHNDWGLFYTPRLHMKYNFSPDVIFRLSGGRSFRTANVFSDNIAIMATSRDLIIEEELKPERAWNFGGNFTALFKAFYRPGSFSVDYYLTDFSNQVIVDMYTSDNEIQIYNLQGNSYSRSFQIAVNYEVFKRFDVRLAYKIDDVTMDYNGISSRKPLVPQNRSLLNISYASKNESWKYNFTTHFQGQTKLGLATTADVNNGNDQESDNKSPAFFTFNAQITKVIKQWDIYLGSENLSNYRQPNPIINANDPFGPGFDATNIWGPVMGRKIYLGFRYSIKSANKPNSKD